MPRAYAGLGLLFGILPTNIPVEMADLFHVAVYITGGIEQRAKPGNLPRVINITQQDGYLRLMRNEVEPAFPVLHGRPAALWWNGDGQVFMYPELLHRLGNHVVVLTAVYWYTAKPFHDTAKGELEQ